VLLVDSQEPSLPAFARFIEGFREALATGIEAPVAIHTLSLDVSHFGGAEPRRAIDSLLQARYGRLPIGAILALGDPAVARAIGWRDALWPGTPVVCLTATADSFETARAAPLTTALQLRFDQADTLRTALAIFPETRRVAVVAGAEVEGRTAPDLGALVAAVDPKLEGIDLIGLPMAELQRRIAALPPHTIVLYADIFLDGAGRHWIPLDALAAFAPHSGSPVFSSAGTHLGHGIVGGSLVDFDALGREAGGLVRRLLAGEPVAALPPAASQAVRLEFDGRELERWGVSDDLLPAGSRVLYRQPSFWQENKGKAVAVGVALLLQSLAITSLLLERRRRRSAEGRLHHLSGRLISAQEDERSRLARDLHDDAGQRLALLAIELDQLRAPSLADSARSLSADLHRMAHQLHPAILDQLGLLPAAQRFAGEVAARHGVTIEVSSQGWPESLPRDAALELYRVLQEALQNAIRHSGAARIEVAFQATGPELRLRVKDAGRGFAPEQLEGAQGLGLAGMRERMRLVGGGLQIQSDPEGGTIVDAWLPAAGVADGVPRANPSPA
jgi:signal transduction histidine kinase